MLLSLLLLPLVGSLLAFLWKSSQARYLALLLAIVQLGLSLGILCQFNYSDSIEGEMTYHLQIHWSQAFKSSINFGLDGLGVLLVLLTNILVPFIILSSFNEKEPYPNTFYALILLMQFGLLGVFTALDGLLFYIFWEVTLIPIWFICGIWGQDDKRIKITTKFFVYTFFGSLFMLVGLVYLYSYANSFAILDLYQASLNTEQQVFIFWMIMLAFAVKLPLFPLHTWQPDTYTYAPTQGSMLLSGIMLKMAVFGILRYLLPITPDALLGISGKLVLMLAICGILYGALIAIVNYDVKRIIAYSSLSHVGLMVAGIFASAMLLVNGKHEFLSEGGVGAMVQTFAHGINVVGLFYCADILIKRFGTRDIRQMGGMARVAPKFAILFMIILLGSMAVPLTNGFIGEFILLKSVFDYNIFAGIISGVTVILAAVYFLRLYGKAMFGEGDTEVLSQVKDLSKVEFLVLAGLSVFVILLGVYPSPIMELVEGPLSFIYKAMIK